MNTAHSFTHEVVGSPSGATRELGQRAADMWLLTKAGDFWLACAGGGLVLIVLIWVLYGYGDHELSLADLLLGELHLGATYDAVARRQLWRRMPLDIFVVPIGILAAVYALTYSGCAILVATATLYLAAWHRARQNLGIARQYQIRMGGALSSWHSRLFRAAVYLPMAAGVAFFASTAPLHEGEEYIGLSLDVAILWGFGALAMASLVAYLAYTVRWGRCLHPGERWLVIANALAFGSAYVFGAWTVSFILVLALHHEVQYLYFTYATARRSSIERLPDRRAELQLIGSFAIWPVIGLASWAACKFSDLPWLAPFLVGGLLCHYWLDSRIWTARARALALR